MTLEERKYSRSEHLKLYYRLAREAGVVTTVGIYAVAKIGVIPTKLCSISDFLNKSKTPFLYLAKRAGYDWLGYVNQDMVDLGSGKSNFVNGRANVSKYQITVLRELDATL